MFFFHKDMKSPLYLELLFCWLIFMLMSWNTSFAETDHTYTNPVLVETINRVYGIMGIGDPTVILHKNKYYLYPTGDNQGYDVYTSADLVNWEKGPRVFQTGERGAWAPDVFYDDISKKFYLYYTVNRRIGVAVSNSPDGTFTDLSHLIDEAIDAHMFKDETGEFYLYYVKFPDFIVYVQPMETLTKKQGNPVQLISPTEQWEKKHTPLTEAPWMLKHGGLYYLIYSASGANTMEYSIGYATSESPLGPFTKYSGNPIMKKGDGVFGPGHASITRDLKGNLWMIYHQQQNSSIGWNRIICIDPIWFDDKGVLHGKATRGSPQPSPLHDVTLSGYRR